MPIHITGRRSVLRGVGGIAGLAALSTTAGTARSVGMSDTVQTGVSLSHIGRYATGVYDDGAAEIPAYDTGSQRLFVVNGEVGRLDVLDISDPTAVSKVDIIDVGLGEPNNVTVRDGIVATAIEAEVTHQNGVVAFYDVAGLEELGRVDVGPLPDMVTFAAGGDYVLTANEGEPTDNYSTDPAGSISVIDVPDDDGAVSPLHPPAVLVRWR